jgi:hypothetical protein
LTPVRAHHIIHFAPLLLGIEIYRGCPDLLRPGAALFSMTKTPVGITLAQMEQRESPDCVFEEGRLVALDLVPSCLNENGIAPILSNERWRAADPIAEGTDAERQSSHDFRNFRRASTSPHRHDRTRRAVLSTATASVIRRT